MTQMPNDVLDDLFYGKISPWEDRPESRDEFLALNQKLGKLSDSLDEHLTKETRELLDQCLPARADMEALLACGNFKTGFRLGARLVLEVCNEP